MMIRMHRMFAGLALCAGAAATAMAAGPAVAAYPEKPITFVVVFGAGGTNDVVGRKLSEPLGKALGQPVVVENRPGAGGNIGAASVARSQPDGYTLLMAFPGLTTNKSLYPSLQYDPDRDFAPVSLLASAPSVIVAHPDADGSSLDAFVAYLKGKPGGANYGSSGNGASSHLAGAMLDDLLGLGMEHVPYKGGAPALTDLAAGRLDLMVIPLPEAMTLIRAGRVKPVMLASAQRSPLVPDVPTTREWGLKDFEVGSWYGLSVPAATPADVVGKLSAAVHEVVGNADIQRELREQGIEPIGSDPRAFADFLRQETDRWSAVIEKNGIKLD